MKAAAWLPLVARGRKTHPWWRLALIEYASAAALIWGGVRYARRALKRHPESPRISVTAEYMALFRALESLRPVQERAFEDRWAGLFLTGARRHLYRAARLGVPRGALERVIDAGAPGARAAGIARTAWLDSLLATELGGIDQVVVLGAGFDSRAWRLPCLGGCRVFEVDRMQTSTAKQAVLARHPLRAAQLAFVAAELGVDTLPGDLAAAGFDVRRPAFFLWEGVTNYMTAAQVQMVLTQVAACAPGSCVALTWVERRLLEQPGEGEQRLLGRLRKLGEAWTFGLDPQSLREYLRDQGLTLVSDRTVVDLWTAMGRAASDAEGYAFYHVAFARVGL